VWSPWTLLTRDDVGGRHAAGGVTAAGLGDVTQVDSRDDGAIAVAGIVHFDDGSTVFAKALPEAPTGLFAGEADGLTALADADATTPAIHRVLVDLLVLEALDPVPDGDLAFWVRLGRMVARVHTATEIDVHGWHRDNWLPGGAPHWSILPCPSPGPRSTSP